MSFTYLGVGYPYGVACTGPIQRDLPSARKLPVAQPTHIWRCDTDAAPYPGFNRVKKCDGLCYLQAFLLAGSAEVNENPVLNSSQMRQVV